MPAALVFAASPVHPAERLLRLLKRTVHDPIVIAADAGASTALDFGFRPDLVVGDFDSLDPAQLGEFRRETFPRDKDQTDGQLAIERALQRGATELVLIGFLGGPRLDMTIANVLFLTGLEVPAVMLDERNEARLLRGPAEHVWTPEPSEIVSLLPISETVEGVTTRGLRWPLQGETLLRSQTRGVSNEPADGESEVSVALRSGLLLLARHFPL